MAAGGTTSVRSEDEYRRMIDQLGGISNAYTTYGHTAYFIKSSSDNVSTALQVLSEWVGFANWTTKEYEREKGVILKEMERSNSNVERKIYQKTQSIYYKDSPYRYPIIGYHDAFLNLSSDDLMRYYKRQYVPENMVVVVAGNVSENAILNHVESTFGGFKAAAPEIRYHANEQRLISSANSVIIMDDIKTQRIIIRYPIVTFFHNDVYPLDLLAYIFGHGEQSLMYQEFVVKQKIATSIDVHSITPVYDYGYFEIAIESSTPPSEVVQRVQLFIDQFRWRRLKKGRIQKAVEKQADYILSKQSLDAMAKDSGQAMMIGQNPLFFEQYSNGFSTINSQDVNRVVQEYLSEDRRQSYVFNSRGEGKASTQEDPKYEPNIEKVSEGLQILR